MATICLAMIVKNEAPVIGRCLASVRPYIARWVVCDTGSTDGTYAEVRKALDGIPGELHNDAWASFGQNRTYSVERARRSRCDYVLVIDADEELVVQDPSVFDRLTHDAYILRERNGSSSWLTMRLVKASLDWHYEGVIHEQLICKEHGPGAVLEGVSLHTEQDGHRSADPAKLEKDITLMTNALQDDPYNPFLWFHLGLAYQQVGELVQAAAAFERRLDLQPEDSPEVWQSRYILGMLYGDLGKDELVAPMLLDAYADWPACAEPLYRLGRFYLAQHKPEQALPYLELASHKQKQDLAFLRQDSVYEFEAELYLGLCYAHIGRDEDAESLLNELYRRGVLTDEVQTATERELAAIFAARGTA